MVGKPEAKRLFGKPKSRWEDNNKRYLQEEEFWTWAGLI